MNEYWNNEEKIEHREIAEATMEKQKKSGGLWRKFWWRAVAVCALDYSEDLVSLR